MSKEDSSDTPESGWVITTCTHCEREIKLRASVSLTELACPYCSEMLDDATSVADTDNDADEQTATPESWESPNAEAAGSSRRHRSAAHNKSEDPAWDRDPSDPESETGEADGEDETDFLEVDPNNPDAVRIRRVRRTQVRTRGQKIYRLTAIVGLSVLAVAGGALLVTAFVKGTVTVTQDIKEVASLPDKVKELIAAARPKDGIIPNILTEDETKAALEILTGYLKADGWEAKLPYVYKPERAAERMGKWYGRQENNAAPLPVGEIALRDKVVEGDNERFIIKIAIETHPGDYKIFALRQTVDDIKIHWESSVGYQQMTLEEFKKSPPGEAVPFRVLLKPDAYYAFEYSDSSKYRCFRMTYPGDIHFNLYGYIDRSDEHLLAGLMNQSALSAIVSLKTNPESIRHEQVQIVDLIQGSWFE